MKILVLSTSGWLTGLSSRIALDNVEVFFYPGHNSLRFESGLNIYKTYPVYKSLMADVDLIICEGPGYGELYKVCRKYKIPIFQCSEIGDLMYKDPVRIYQVFAKAGVNTPDTVVTNKVTDLNNRLVNWVQGVKIIKVKDQVVRCTSREFLAWAIPRIPPKTHYLIQENVSGIPVDVFGLFNGRVWLEPSFIGCKKIGGALVQQDKVKKLRNTVLQKLTPFLRRIDYRGFVTVNMIVNKENHYAINLTLGLDATYMELVVEGIKDPDVKLYNVMHDVANSQVPEFPITYDYLAAINVRTAGSSVDGAPIVNTSPQNLKHIFLEDANRFNDDFYMAGSQGRELVYTATAHGRTHDEVRRRVGQTVKNIEIIQPVYSQNTITILGNDFHQLDAWGYL